MVFRKFRRHQISGILAQGGCVVAARVLGSCGAVQQRFIKALWMDLVKLSLEASTNCGKQRVEQRRWRRRRRSSKASGWMKLVLSRQPRWSQSAAAPRLVGDGDPVVVLSRLAQPFSSYCSKSVGPGFKGILTSDRYSAYNWLAVSQQRLLSQARFHPNCRTRGHRQKGRALLEQEKHLFALWYQVRDGTLSRRDLRGGCTDSLTSP